MVLGMYVALIKSMDLLYWPISLPSSVRDFFQQSDTA